MTALRIDIATTWTELDAAENEWTELLQRSDCDEPTLTPTWLGEWWRTFGGSDGRRLRVVLFRQQDRLVGIAPFVHRRHWYPPGIPFRRLELAPSGEGERDEVCSDYIGVVAERGREWEIARALCRVLVDGALGAWDELVMPAMNGETILPSILSQELKSAGMATTCELTAVAPYIPLPTRFDEYLSKLPQSRRYLVKRSVRDFERWAAGTLEFEHASDASGLERGLRILSDLHGRRWQKTGQDGVFASEAFMKFHGAVLPALLRKGALDLCWMSAHGEPVAALYNIHHRRKVYFYQSGRSPELDSALRPGVVLHAYAIRRAIESGLREYDFLAGASRYKMQLALGTRPIVCLRAARPSWPEAARALTRSGALHWRALQKSSRRQEPAAPERFVTA